MSNGPERSRLDQALDTTNDAEVERGAKQWLLMSSTLDRVSQALDSAAKLDIRGETGRSMKGAFTRSAESTREKNKKLHEGKQALADVATAIERARTARQALDTDPDTATVADPGTFRPDPDKTKAENETARGLHNGEVSAFWDRYQKRETAARQIAQQLEQDFADAAARMKAIHGEPDPDPITVREPGEGTTTPTTPTGPRSPHNPPTLTTPPRPPEPPLPPEPPEPPRPPEPPLPPQPPEPPHPPQPPVPPTPPVPTDPDVPPIGTDPGGPGSLGGIATGVGTGLGVAGLANAIRGGLAVPGQTVRPSGTRPIGSTSRSAVSGALGRGAGAGSPVSRGGTRGTGGRGTTGRGAAGAAGQNGKRGTPSGSRSGGRGTGAAGAAGRRGGKKDDEEKKADRDLFDDGQDWVDDEDAATGLLD